MKFMSLIEIVAEDSDFYTQLCFTYTQGYGYQCSIDTVGEQSFETRYFESMTELMLYVGDYIGERICIDLDQSLNRERIYGSSDTLYC